MDLINSLIKEGWLKTPQIIKAFEKIKRIDFLPEEVKDLAELDEALPIGYGQTISQPLVVAFMLELLQPEKGEKILDIGSGSGWTSALLGEIAGKQGKVVALEVIPELMESGKKNIAKYNFIKKGIVELICTDGSKGYEKEAPFDKILASATAVGIPENWKLQLKINGRIVAPVNSSIWELRKKKSEARINDKFFRFGQEQDFIFEKKEHPGFVFVPLLSK